MNALIIEDEMMAARSLQRALEENFPDIQVVGHTGSVAETIDWLSDPSHQADILFMDVELSDGQCFEIFRRKKITSHVIMTTAYDSYAVKAFEVNSLDYLLKPIDNDALRRAVQRCKGATPQQPIDIESIARAIARPQKVYKERYLVYLGDRIVPIKTEDIACFFAESKAGHVVTRSGSLYVVDTSLDTIITELNPDIFFRISRSCIIAKEMVESVSKLLGGRLNVTMKVRMPKDFAPDFTVSRARVDDFLVWLGK